MPLVEHTITFDPAPDYSIYTIKPSDLLNSNIKDKRSIIVDLSAFDFSDAKACFDKFMEELKMQMKGSEKFNFHYFDLSSEAFNEDDDDVKWMKNTRPEKYFFTRLSFIWQMIPKIEELQKDPLNVIILRGYVQDLILDAISCNAFGFGNLKTSVAAQAFSTFFKRLPIPDVCIGLTDSNRFIDTEVSKHFNKSCTPENNNVLNTKVWAKENYRQIFCNYFENSIIFEYGVNPCDSQSAFLLMCSSLMKNEYLPIKYY